jgi:hypothetical protein
MQVPFPYDDQDERVDISAGVKETVTADQVSAAQVLDRISGLIGTVQHL